jgi:prophage maintenance system killer protein
VQDLGLLRATLGFVQMMLLSDLESKVFLLVLFYKQNHTFADRNKRSSIALSAYFFRN